jgi:putative transposase
MPTRKVYPSDVSDAEWALLAPLLAGPVRQDRRGRPVRVDRREVVNAIFYVLRTGCQWRYLPQEFPKWQTVYWYFARWLDDGTWERLNDTLRRQVRVWQGRQPEPSAAILDSQSVKTTEKGASGATTQARR